MLLYPNNTPTFDFDCVVNIGAVTKLWYYYSH
jgi:hypothetical protein